MAPGSGPVPAETSACLTCGAVTARETVRMAATRLGVSAGAPPPRGEGTSRGPGCSLPLGLRPAQPASAAGPDVHSLTRMEVS